MGPRRLLRLLQVSLARGEQMDLHDVLRVRRRVWPGDLDELRHVNNGVYLSMLDLARYELLKRSGVWRRMQQARLYPVVAAQTIAYRKSLRLGQRFGIETRVLGYDARAVYLEQRFVVHGEIYARAHIQGRFLRRGGGVVPMVEVGELVGIDIHAHPAPEWLHEWARAVALPSTRKPAPSDWG
ncbi:acyl-CoA thioesterase [Lysobacter korlensis]|uniref:Acyl-CoA thioesterase n=1 Tax=Lysobacter korlensis TaxID=553636 RepID=A0ABV6S0C2_9GAMM